MWVLNYALLALFVSPGYAAWQTIYNANYSMVYFQSVNGSVYQLPISSQNVTEKDIEHSLRQIKTPPGNSSLVIDNDGHLLAVWGSKGCGSSPIEISQYHHNDDQWLSIAQSDIKTQSWYQDSQIVWLDRNNDHIYIYGGACNGATRSGFYRYNLVNNSFDQPNTDGRIMPRQMAAAQAVPLSDYDTLILGGKSGNAWVSMQQVASWGQGSWTFHSVSNSTGIDSRENPLLLPVWKLGQNGTSTPINEVLVIGGTVAGRAAKPHMASLKYSEAQGWYWTVPDQSDQFEVSFSAGTLYSTLANLNFTDSDQLSSSSPSKVSAPSGIQLFGMNAQSQWSPVSSVSVVKSPSADTAGSSSQSSSSDSHGDSKGSTSTATIAVVSTLLPIILIALLGISAWWWWRKQRQRRLFLHPNRQSMLRRQPSGNSSVNTSDMWSPNSVQLPIPPITSQHQRTDTDRGSIMMMDSVDGRRLFMSKQRRSLRVVNPDDEGAKENSRDNSRESSWSSSSRRDPFGDNAECRSEFDFGL